MEKFLQYNYQYFYIIKAQVIIDIDQVNKMAQYGYDKERFPNLSGDMFDCPICTNVVVNPKECLGCGDLFCGKCIDDWHRKQQSCPKRCNASIQPMASKALIKIYEDLDIKCQFCQLLIKLKDLTTHELNCNRTKCTYFEYCKGYQQENTTFGKSICSEQCSLLHNILSAGGNLKKSYEVLCKFTPKQEYPKIDNKKVSDMPFVNSNKNIPPSSTSSNSLYWNPSKCGQGLQFQNNGALVFLREPAYVFRTSISETGFNSGCHYWQIIPDGRTQNELKIGVSTTNNFDFNTAFCDHVFGYAYYGLGQLRHSSNASGPQYGKRLKKQGVLGVFLNMDKGQLSFSLNGQNMGVAFENVALKVGPIYPAVALLHCAGCLIKGQLPVPNIFPK